MPCLFEAFFIRAAYIFTHMLSVIHRRFVRAYSSASTQLLTKYPPRIAPTRVISLARWAALQQVTTQKRGVPHATYYQRFEMPVEGAEKVMLLPENKTRERDPWAMSPAGTAVQDASSTRLSSFSQRRSREMHRLREKH